MWVWTENVSTEFHSTSETGGRFQLSFVSSYMDFGVPILPWAKGKGLCNGKTYLYQMEYLIGFWQKTKVVVFKII